MRSAIFFLVSTGKGRPGYTSQEEQNMRCQEKAALGSLDTRSHFPCNMFLVSPGMWSDSPSTNKDKMALFPMSPFSGCLIREKIMKEEENKHNPQWKVQDIFQTARRTHHGVPLKRPDSRPTTELNLHIFLLTVKETTQGQNRYIRKRRQITAPIR